MNTQFLQNKNKEVQEDTVNESLACLRIWEILLNQEKPWSESVENVLVFQWRACKHGLSTIKWGALNKQHAQFSYLACSFHFLYLLSSWLFLNHFLFFFGPEMECRDDEIMGWIFHFWGYMGWLSIVWGWVLESEKREVWKLEHSQQLAFLVFFYRHTWHYNAVAFGFPIK